MFGIHSKYMTIVYKEVSILFHSFLPILQSDSTLLNITLLPVIPPS